MKKAGGKSPEQAALETRLEGVVKEAAESLGLEAEASGQDDVLAQLGERALLLRHAPVLRYDSQAPWRADSAATITDNPGNMLLRADGRVIARPPELSLEFLSRYADPSPDDRLSEGGGEAAHHRDIAKLRNVTIAAGGLTPMRGWSTGDDFPRYGEGQSYFPKYADRMYGRVVHEARRTWLQFWLWFYFTPGTLLGRGRHQGAWKVLQVGLDDHANPILVTYSQRGGNAEARRWKDVERLAGDARPVAYVATFSHACYFAPGTYPSWLGVDSAYGDGPSVSPFLELFGDWVTWPGRWGGSRGAVFGAGRSPRGPAYHPAWSSPAGYHRRAGQRRSRARRIAHQIGKTAYPAAPKIDAELSLGPAGSQLRVRFLSHRTARRRARFLWVSVHAPHDGELLASRLVPVYGDEGEAVLHLRDGLSECIVRASAYTRLELRSDVAEAHVQA